MPLVCMLLLAGIGHSEAATAVDWSLQHAAEVEAAYLLNFARYTDWPADAFDDPAAPLVIGVVGPAWLARTIRAVAEAADPIHGRTVRVVHWRRAPESMRLTERRRPLHVLFIDASAEREPPVRLRALAGRPVLTVGNGERFVEHGGMLGLVRADRRILFNANPAAIQAAGLIVSSKVLKLADELTEPPR